MKQPRPILIHRDELARAFKILEEHPSTPYVLFNDYEIGGGEPIVPTKIAEEMKAILAGTHPMFDKEYLVKKLDQIKKECGKLGIEMANRPMHEVLIELNAKKRKAPTK